MSVADFNLLHAHICGGKYTHSCEQDPNTREGRHSWHPSSTQCRVVSDDPHSLDFSAHNEESEKNEIVLEYILA